MGDFVLLESFFAPVPKIRISPKPTDLGIGSLYLSNFTVLFQRLIRTLHTTRHPTGVALLPACKAGCSSTLLDDKSMKTQHLLGLSLQLRCLRVFWEGEWRRDRDSNPGYLAVYTLSKRAPSATRPSLRSIAGLFEGNTVGATPEVRPPEPQAHGACAIIFCFTIADDFSSIGTPCIRYRRSVDGSPQLICHPWSMAIRMYCPGRTFARSKLPSVFV
jgi:hypothetical protein